MCAKDSDFVKKRYGGYFQVFLGLLMEEGEIWDMYRVSLGEFPGEEELEDYEGFVITGSTNDAHGNDPWVCNLVSLLRKLDSMHKKLLGFCFGHQVSLSLRLFGCSTDMVRFLSTCGLSISMIRSDPSLDANKVTILREWGLDINASKYLTPHSEI